jgi:hypothetical protein
MFVLSFDPPTSDLVAAPNCDQQLDATNDGALSSSAGDGARKVKPS